MVFLWRAVDDPLKVVFGSFLSTLGPSINGLVTDRNTKLCCRGFIFALFQRNTANKIDSEYTRDYNGDQARGRLGRNRRPRGRNFALNGTQGEVGVSLKKKKKKKKIFFFFLGRLIFILSPHKCKLW